MKKTFLVAAALTAVILISAAKTAHADEGCSGQYGQYGKCPSSQTIMIDKTVGKVISNGSTTATIEYVDNLSVDDRKFKAGEFIYFQLKIKNTSDRTESNIKIVDYVPGYLDAVEGPGTWDSNARTVTFYIPELKSNEEKVFTLKMQLRTTAQLNALNDGTCVNNRAIASFDNVSDEDAAQFCVEKTVTGVTQVPSTGPEHWIAVLTASIASLGMGVALKKKAN